MLDIVYPVRFSETNEELRYSLRSLKNINHGNVFLVGFVPSWAQNIIPIKRLQLGRTKYVNAQENLIAAIQHPDLADDFLLFNDDFFITSKIGEYPNYHRGLLEDVINEHRQLKCGGFNPYLQGMIEGRNFLDGIDNIQRPLLSYELHIPMLYNKEKLKELLKIQQQLRPMNVVQPRTMYGNYYKIGGTKVADVKIYDIDQTIFPDHIPFISTSDRTWNRGEIGNYLRKKFNRKSDYEV